MGEIVTQLIVYFKNISFPELGIGFILGLIIGFILKKSIKFFLFLIILSLIILIFVTYKEYIDLNNAILANQSDRVVDILKQMFTFIKKGSELFSFEISSSAIFGLFIGFKLG